MASLPIPGSGDLPFPYSISNATNNLLVSAVQNTTEYNSTSYNISPHNTDLISEKTILNHSPYSMTVNIILIIIFILVIIWTIVGNLTVIVSVKTSPALRASPSNILVTNLALSDLLLGLLVLPFSSTVEVAGFWPLGREVCYMWLLIGMYQSIMPILLHLSWSIERQFKISKRKWHLVGII